MPKKSGVALHEIVQYLKLNESGNGEDTEEEYKHYLELQRLESYGHFSPVLKGSQHLRRMLGLKGVTAE